MSVRERNRYATAVAAFLIAFGILCALFLRSAMVMAQITFTWRPQGATTDTYQGGNLTDCGSEITISATQGLGLAFDQNLTTAATTYTDADISIDNPGMAVGEEDTTFTESGKWSNFRQTTTFITDVDLLVRISGANNSETTRQWAIEYTVDGPISSTWHEMVRFTIYYATVAEEVYLSAGDEILNTALDPADVGYVRTIDTGTDQLVLERYYPGEFESWDVDDTIENLDASFSTTISTASSIEDNPPTGTVLGQVLGNDATRAFLTDDPDDPDYILDVLSSKLAVRTRTKQQGCKTEPNQCPLCKGDPLAKLNIHDIQVEAEWDTETGGDDGPLIIITESLPDANKYSSYSESVEAFGGNKGYTWQIISGSLPPEFNPSYPGGPDYEMQIAYSSPPPYTVPGTHNFTVKVTDSSIPVQTAQKPLSIHVAGLAIDPAGPDLPPAIKGAAYSQTFTRQGGSTDYKWCIVSGMIPPGLSFTPSCPYCPSTTTGNNISITLSGTPTNAGSYGFTLKLTDGSGETPAEHYYKVDVSTSGVEIIKRLLKPMIKGVLYRNNPSVPATYQRMEAQSLKAVRVIYSATPGQVTWSSTPTDLLPWTGLTLTDTTLDTVDKISRAYIVGTIPMTESAGDYRFTANVNDSGSDSDSESDLMLRVLERKTLLLKSPPSSVQLPSDHTLKFVVFAEGGAPSTATGITADGSKVPYYNYDWSVTPVNSNSPALGTASGTTSPNKAEPETTTITFEDGSSIPVSGVYDVRFWARDVLRRENAGAAYEFVPATVRLRVNAPADVEKRPIKLRQEQF